MKMLPWHCVKVTQLHLRALSRCFSCDTFFSVGASREMILAEVAIVSADSGSTCLGGSNGPLMSTVRVRVRGGGRERKGAGRTKRLLSGDERLTQH